VGVYEGGWLIWGYSFRADIVVLHRLDIGELVTGGAIVSLLIGESISSNSAASQKGTLRGSTRAGRDHSLTSRVPNSCQSGKGKGCIKGRRKMAYVETGTSRSSQGCLGGMPQKGPIRPRLELGANNCKVEPREGIQSKRHRKKGGFGTKEDQAAPGGTVCGCAYG